MHTPNSSLRPFLLAVLLVAIGLRSVLGAPCCAFVEQANMAQETHLADHTHHEGHEDAAQSGHKGHGDDPSANPCCSACGPTLPPEPTVMGNVSLVASAPVAEPIRQLATRPPFPAYEARGPPLRI